MEKRMAYSLYKIAYKDFPARDYDKASKTIIVELPAYKAPKIPASWEKIGGNIYAAPNGAKIYFWNTGLARNFLVEHGAGYAKTSKTFPAGLYALEKVINHVNSL